MADRSGYIGRAPGDSSVIIARKAYEPTGVQTDFTFNSGYTPGYCDVYLNGVKLIDEKDYTASNGSTVGLTSAAQSGDIVELVVYKAFICFMFLPSTETPPSTNALILLYKSVSHNVNLASIVVLCSVLSAILSNGYFK